MGAGFFKASYFHDLTTVEYTQEQKTAIEKQIGSEPVLVFSKDYCPYCKRTKQLLSQHDVKAKIIEINLSPDCLQTAAILLEITGQKTVPNIFVGGKSIGGNSEIQKLAQSGELKVLLDGAGVDNSF